MSLKVLVVDDDDLTRVLFYEMLTSLHCEVSVVSSGADTEEVVLFWQPDMIFLDYRMPYQDGCITAQRLRQNAYTGYIVLMSVLALAGGEFDRCQANSFIRKPVTLASLRKQLEAVGNAKSFL